MKADLIIRKNNEYRRLEFSRRKLVAVSDFHTYITTIEDLIIAKLIWAKDSFSEIQLNDIRALLEVTHDRAYLDVWVMNLGLQRVLQKAKNE